MPRRAQTIALTIVAVSAAVFLLQLTASVLIPLVVALLLFYALDPVVYLLVRWHIPRPSAALITIEIGPDGESSGAQRSCWSCASRGASTSAPVPASTGASSSGCRTSAGPECASATPASANPFLLKRQESALPQARSPAGS